MIERIPLGVDRLLQSRLREAEELLPFTRAVVLHLSRGSGAGGDPADIAEAVLAVLEPAIRPVPSGRYDAGDNLALLSSFFQNADLLDPASPRTRVIARSVMAAVERIEAHP